MRAVLAITLSILFSDSASSEGALVVGRDPAGFGTAITIVNKRTTKIAYDEAMDICDRTRINDCEIKKMFSNTCVATAYSRNGGMAWAFGASTLEAERAAVQQCKGSFGACVAGYNSACDWRSEMTFLCTDPIFKERRKLLMEVADNSSRGDHNFRAIRYLESKYCAYADGPPTEDRSREDIGLSCSLATGLFRGERVFWEVCDARE